MVTVPIFLRKYIYGPGIDEPVCMIDANGNMYYYTYDGLGSVTALWHNGTVKTVVERYSYTPFGQTTVCDAAGNPKTSNISDFGNRFMFTGREYDCETGLYYYRARMYSPALGRFMQPDPIGYADSMNLYQYCGNNPVNFVDPWGLKSKEGGFWGDFGNALLGEAGPIAGALMRGGAQMAVNALQGLQDTAIGLVNIALIGSWMMCEQAGSDDPQGYLDIIFPSPQWARGMVCEQSDIEYEGSKMASTLLIGWGVSKLGGATSTNDAAPLHRPYLRKSTKTTVENNAIKTADGKFINNNTGNIIEGKHQYGHIYGRENWRLIEEAKEMGMTQGEFNDWVNSHPEWFQIEDPKSNMSHQYEKPR